MCLRVRICCDSKNAYIFEASILCHLVDAHHVLPVCVCHAHLHVALPTTDEDISEENIPKENASELFGDDLYVSWPASMLGI